MRQFLSGQTKPRSDAPHLSGATTRGRSGSTIVRDLCLALLACISLLSPSFAQHPFTTTRADNRRGNANASETLLTPSNVNKAGFGLLFSAPVDNVVMAQPLYMPNVTINGQVHNVVYIVTMADSVYAIDADSGAQLWWVNYTNPSQGITTAQNANKTLPCGSYVGFSEEGIIGTPVIDPANNTMYLVAKTVVNGTTVQHHLHAVDITTGNDLATPVLITATSVSELGHKTVFNSLHQKNRPGLLLLDGTLYLAFGSNGCNDANSGWMLSYNEATLTQTGIFNTSPDQGLTSIWQAGSGIAADENNNIFFETAEADSNGYDIQSGGQTYCNSVVKLIPGEVDSNNQYLVQDYFTPWNVAYLNSNDFDLSSTGALVLPDQTGPYPHELIAGGKYGMVYVLNRDNMGHYSAGADSQIIQELTLVQQPEVPNDVLFGTPAYWNNTVYFAPDAAPVMAFPVLPSGQLGTPVETVAKHTGSHSPSISANGNSNGILWVLSDGLNAFDAVSMKLLYDTNQAAGGRDTLGTPGHFVTQTVANGKVYVAAETAASPATYALRVYGLFRAITVTSGGAQSAPAATVLPASIQINVSNPYTGQPNVGAIIIFSDGGKGGVFSPYSGSGTGSATTDANGNASIAYTVPQKAGSYTLTATVMVYGVASGSVTTTATATPGAATMMIGYGGGGQTGADGFGIAEPIIAQVKDAYKNPVAGVTIKFTANKGSAPNSSVVTNASGMALYSSLRLPSAPSTVLVTATPADITLTPNKETYAEYSVAPIATTIVVSSGNNQYAPPGTQLPQALAVLVTDQYGNPFSGNSVTFSDNGAGGTFSNGNTVVTGANGIATEFYTLSPAAATVSITATGFGISSPAVFTESVR
jgi:hypothetical protein